MSSNQYVPSAYSSYIKGEDQDSDAYNPQHTHIKREDRDKKFRVRIQNLEAIQEELTKENAKLKNQIQTVQQEYEKKIENLNETIRQLKLDYDRKLKRVIDAAEILNNAKLGLTFADTTPTRSPISIDSKIEDNSAFPSTTSSFPSTSSSFPSSTNSSFPSLYDDNHITNNTHNINSTHMNSNFNNNMNNNPHTDVNMNINKSTNLNNNINNINNNSNKTFPNFISIDQQQSDNPSFDPSKYKVVSLELCTKNQWQIPQESCQILQSGQYYAVVRMGPVGKEVIGQGSNSKPKLALYEAYHKAMLQLFSPNDLNTMIKGLNQPPAEKKHPKCIIMEYCVQNGLSPPHVEHLPNESGMGWVCKVTFLNLVTFGKSATKKDAQAQAFEEIVARLEELST